MNKPPDYFDLSEVAKFYSDAINKLVYPTKPAKPKRENFKNNASYGDALDYYETAALVSYKAGIKIYNEFKNQIESEFKDEVLERIGVKGHPKAEKLWGKAWEKGHAYGLQEVAYIADDLAELLK